MALLLNHSHLNRFDFIFNFFSNLLLQFTQFVFLLEERQRQGEPLRNVRLGQDRVEVGSVPGRQSRSEI